MVKSGEQDIKFKNGNQLTNSIDSMPERRLILIKSTDKKAAGVPDTGIAEPQSNDVIRGYQGIGINGEHLLSTSFQMNKSGSIDLGSPTMARVDTLYNNKGGRRSANASPSDRIVPIYE